MSKTTQPILDYEIYCELLYTVQSFAMLCKLDIVVILVDKHSTFSTNFDTKFLKIDRVNIKAIRKFS